MGSTLGNNLPSISLTPDYRKQRRSVGIDSFSFKFIWEFSDLLAPLLCHIFNVSTQTGIFPEALKIANTIPIPKTSANLNLASNYRPISLLSNFSKLFESMIFKRLSLFFDKYKVLYDFQFGFRKKYSTTLALLNTLDDINSRLDEKMYVAGIFMDFSKAFDALDYSILLTKLYNYGVRGDHVELVEQFSRRT